MEQPDLGKRIAILRKAKGLTQEELAIKCNVSARTLQRIEAGVVVPRAYTVRAVFNALDHTADNSLKKIPGKRLYAVSRSYFECIYKYFIDLFNLKTNTMKKVSVLSVMALAIGFGLFASFSDCYSQNVKATNYVKDNSTGIEILLPKGLKGYGSYFTNDTLNVRVGKDIIQEYKGKVFLNRKYSGYAIPGDTVTYKKGTLFTKPHLIFKRQIPAFISNGIIFISPYSLSSPKSTQEGEIYPVGNYKIKEYKNQIFLDDVYQGDAFANDTIILRKNGTLIIRNNRQE